jgi:hypothetical protein
MTSSHFAGMLEQFKHEIGRLAREIDDDHEFLSVYADEANALEAHCSPDLPDHVRSEILAVIREVHAQRRTLNDPSRASTT